MFLIKDYKKAVEYIDITLNNDNLSNYERDNLNCIKNIINSTNDLEKYSKAMIKDSNELVYKTEKYLKRLKAPTCPRCDKCRNKCKYEEWKFLNNLIFEKSKQLERKFIL